MYRQIKVDSRDTPFQKIVWRASPFLPILNFELKTVTYGTSSAPFLALRVLKKLAVDEGQAFPRAKDILQRSTYVDDCFFGADSIADALEVRDELITLLMRAQMPLAKWSANDGNLLSGLNSPTIPESDKFSRDETIHVLGITWNPQTDSFLFSVSDTTFMRPTKRLILSTIAKIFDPLGWLSPVIICAKIFIQTLWSAHLDWDDVLSDELTQQWRGFHEQLPLLRNVCIPRWVGTSSLRDRIQLHGFCDASSRAYAAAIYARVQTPTSVKASLLIAKTKVAPCQTLTIPRLELCGAVLLARLLQFVVESLAIVNPPCYCWSDSMVVLSWLNSSPANWKTFVANRVSEIQRRIPSAEWRHVGTADNPSDCASRGLRPQEFLEQGNWWVGPPWLVSPSNQWPSNKVIEAPSAVEMEQRVVVHAQVARAKETWEIFRKFSSWSRLMRVTATLYRVAARARKLPFPKELTVLELKRAREFWLKCIQRDLFADDIAAIEVTGVPSSRELVHLSPFVDADGWLRVRGRLEKARSGQNAKQPVLLKSHYLVRLMIRERHTELFHCGPSLLLATLRREFWILRPRPLIRSVLYGCTICARYRAQPAQQLMGDLPAVRVNPSSRPFLHTGVDYAGPIAVRTTSGRGIKSTKSYIAVFVCMVTKAIHIEVASDYTTAAFHAVLQRFMARRGVPSDLYSDNGTNFVGEQRELAAAIRAVIHDSDLQNMCAGKGINWHFIPPAAPHFGGLWEVAVRSVKRALVKAVGSHTLTYEELSTVLCRVEACINSRPLFPLSDSIEDYSVLTPAHFFTGDSLLSVPEPSVLDVTENRLSRWQLTQKLAEQFWKSWSQDYLHTLQQRSKWLKPNESITPGRLVLIINPGMPPSQWALARIVECHFGDDGLVRVVSVRTSSSTFKRPITKICLLPGEINKAIQNHPTSN